MQEAIENILIVGAGPTGITLAATLSGFDVDYDIVDCKHSPSGGSKGLSSNVMTQYIFSLLGVESNMFKSGEPLRKLNLYSDKNRVLSVDFNKTKNIKHLIAQPQSITEEELLNAVGQSEVNVKWAIQVTDIINNGDSYEVTFEDENGTVKKKSYKYVVGCDGKRSVVRQNMEVTFEGEQYPAYFALGDFYSDKLELSEEVSYIQYNNRFVIIIPLGNSNFRIVATSEKELLADTEISRYLSEQVNFYFGKEFFTSPAKWTSSALIYYSIASSLIDGNLVLCGDSGHLVSPIGGTGMNMGVADAFSLGVTLSDIILGTKKNASLNDYNEDRLPVIRHTCESVDYMTRLIVSSEFRKNNAREFISKFLVPSAYRTYKPLQFLGLSEAYDCYEGTTSGNYSRPKIGTMCAELLPIMKGGGENLGRIKGLVFATTGLACDEQGEHVDVVNKVKEYINTKYSHALRCAINSSKLSIGVVMQKKIMNFPDSSVLVIGSTGRVEYVGILTDFSQLKRFIESTYVSL